MRKNLFPFFAHLVLILGGITVIGPLIWMMLGSFKTNAEISAFLPTFLPRYFNLENYYYIFKFHPMLRYFINTIIYTASNL